MIQNPIKFLVLAKNKYCSIALFHIAVSRSADLKILINEALKEILIAGTVNYSNLQKIKFQKSKFIFVETNCFYI